MTCQPPAPPRHAADQCAAIALRIGKRVRLRGEVAVTPLGLASIGALVSSVLLSTAVLVHMARRGTDDR